MNAAAALLIALVADDGLALRSGPNDAAPAQATLYRGDWLEVRGEVPGFLKVWDHRRERGGYVRPRAVRMHATDDSAAGELAAVVRFLRDAEGSESLGVGYAALYLRVAAPERRARREWSEVLAGLGTMAERLARRASRERGAAGKWESNVLAGQLAVIEGYGVGLRRLPRGERTIICYDGDAFARVLVHAAATPADRAQAALALTGRGCLDPVVAAGGAPRRAWNEARLAVLAEADPLRPPMARLARPLAHRVRLRTAEALAEAAHAEAAQGAIGEATGAAAEALRQLALVDRGELAPEDAGAYEEAALRVAAVRWLTEAPETRARPVGVTVVAGRPGETCVRLGPAGKPAQHERCTFGVVFASSVRVAPNGRVVALAVAPLPAWTELWIFRAEAGGWRADVLPPAAGQPGEDVGYVELAGFAPDGARVLVAREYKVGGRPGRRFELLAADGLAQSWSSFPDRLLAFKRWASPAWRRSTLALR